MYTSVAIKMSMWYIITSIRESEIWGAMCGHNTMGVRDVRGMCGHINKGVRDVGECVVTSIRESEMWGHVWSHQ